MITREMLCSVVGGRALQYVRLSKPSDIIPFKGSFPLLDAADYALFRKAIEETELLTDLSVKWQKIAEKGNLIAILEEGFKSYINNETAYTVEEFKALSNAEKSNILVAWMNRDGIDVSKFKV